MNGEAFLSFVVTGTLLLFIFSGLYQFMKSAYDRAGLQPARKYRKKTPKPSYLREREWVTVQSIEAEFQSAERIMRALGERNQ